MRMLLKSRVSGRAQRGVSTAELLVATAVSGLLTLVGVPLIDETRRAAAMGRAAAQVQGLLTRCRAVAVVRCRPCAVVFDRGSDGEWRCYVAEDGDGDGVRRSDISSGQDVVVGRVITIAAGGAGPGILREVAVPDPSGRGSLTGRHSRSGLLTSLPSAFPRYNGTWAWCLSGIRLLCRRRTT